MKCCSPSVWIRPTRNMEQSRKVKHMKKKIWTLICICLLATPLTACEKEDVAEKVYAEMNGAEVTGQDIKDSGQQYVDMLNAYDDAMLSQQLEQVSSTENATAYQEIAAWLEAKKDEGEFVEYGAFDITEANGTLTIEQELIFENRSLMYTRVAEADTLTLQSANFEKVYSIGEKMSKAGMNTLMGMGVVFAVLILISLIIYCFRIIPYLQNRKKNQAAQIPEQGDKVVEQIAQKEEQLQDDLELVAVISAAIAAATGSTTNDFVVRSIKRR